MNQNDMDRYFWRTGQRWSGDSRSIKGPRAPRLVLSRWTILFLAIGFALTFFGLILQR